MSPLIRGVTYGLWVLPLLLGGIGIWRQSQVLIMVAIWLVTVFVLVWLGCRPAWLDLNSTSLNLMFPLWQRTLPLQSFRQAHLLDSLEVNAELGWTMRMGVGGLWGTFGWLWTQKRGWVEVYLTSLEEFVLVERQQGLPLLITPEHPPHFVQHLNQLIGQR
jgi:hypothetical protein